jgi:hypothetical protein
LLALVLVGAASSARALSLLSDRAHTALAGGSLIFISLNLSLLLCFLAQLRAYERSGSSLDEIRQLGTGGVQAAPRRAVRAVPRFHTISELGAPACVACGDRCLAGA